MTGHTGVVSSLGGDKDLKSQSKTLVFRLINLYF